MALVEPFYVKIQEALVETPGEINDGVSHISRMLAQSMKFTVVIGSNSNEETAYRAWLEDNYLPVKGDKILEPGSFNLYPVEIDKNKSTLYVTFYEKVIRKRNKIEVYGPVNFKILIIIDNKGAKPL